MTDYIIDLKDTFILTDRIDEETSMVSLKLGDYLIVRGCGGMKCCLCNKSAKYLYPEHDRNNKIIFTEGRCEDHMIAVKQDLREREKEVKDYVKGTKDDWDMREF